MLNKDRSEIYLSFDVNGKHLILDEEILTPLVFIGQSSDSKRDIYMSTPDGAHAKLFIRSTLVIAIVCAQK